VQGWNHQAELNARRVPSNFRIPMRRTAVLTATGAAVVWLGFCSGAGVDRLLGWLAPIQAMREV
jgi:hypothetical protein